MLLVLAVTRVLSGDASYQARPTVPWRKVLTLISGIRRSSLRSRERRFESYWGRHLITSGIVP